MEFVLDLQAMEATETPDAGGAMEHGGGGSNLSLLTHCGHSALSLLTC
ncbi:SapB/AmfS family lanthipeptide [Streptoalloteichus hindustanus]|uniref:SapB/AmfS family lantipeptide n=1 Tax=Streptoalloteichus hindustanus TaxID=2017 RepID=A0A1M4Y4J3_STRHI|nr:SapB/AmfS family lanthipeptide [Streptoalloteichus hindustanus]SHF00724.1 hypothetical protein SAMN05444320_102235 [Streptoalloteichus hindustanus]